MARSSCTRRCSIWAPSSLARGFQRFLPWLLAPVAGSSVPFSPPHQARGGGRRGNSPFPWAASPTWEQEHPTQRPATRRGFQVLIDKLYTKSSCTQLLTSLHFKKKKETQPKKKPKHRRTAAASACVRRGSRKGPRRCFSSWCVFV